MLILIPWFTQENGWAFWHQYFRAGLPNFVMSLLHTHRLKIKPRWKCFLELWLGSLFWSMNKPMSPSRDAPEQEKCQCFQPQCLCCNSDCYLWFPAQERWCEPVCSEKSLFWCYNVVKLPGHRKLNSCNPLSKQYHSGWLGTTLEAGS